MSGNIWKFVVLCITLLYDSFELLNHCWGSQRCFILGRNICFSKLVSFRWKYVKCGCVLDNSLAIPVNVVAVSALKIPLGLTSLQIMWLWKESWGYLPHYLLNVSHKALLWLVGNICQWLYEPKTLHQNQFILFWSMSLDLPCKWDIPVQKNWTKQDWIWIAVF